MGKFLKKYTDQLLIIIALLFVGLLVGFFADTTEIIAENFSRAISPPPATNGALRFHLEDAKKLDLRGLE